MTMTVLRNGALDILLKGSRSSVCRITDSAKAICLSFAQEEALKKHFTEHPLFSVTVDGYSDIAQRHQKISDIAQRH